MVTRVQPNQNIIKLNKKYKRKHPSHKYPDMISHQELFAMKKKHASHTGTNKGKEQLQLQKSMKQNTMHRHNTEPAGLPNRNLCKQHTETNIETDKQARVAKTFNRHNYMHKTITTIQITNRTCQRKREDPCVKL